MISSSKILEIKSNAFNKSILIVPMHNYAIFMLSNLCDQKKGILKLSLCRLCINCLLLKISHFWVQNVLENAITHCKMKIYIPVGCLNVPKVKKCMQTKAQPIIQVTNDSSVKKNFNILYIQGCAKPSEVYLVPYVVAVSEKNLFTKKSHLTWFK